ncbi:hypothetical protein [Azospirillum brasilense]|uniref:hypothetical protein n=1 Tax=Azospirillum brasilense TaxID=192 RepID=UPI0014788092|nr:hypothetical protein [Azospirillum brasilense]
MAVVVSDHFGNPISRVRLPFPEAGTEEGVAAAKTGDAVRGLCALATQHGAGLAVEKLDFSRKKAALKEYGRKHARRLSIFAYKAFYKALEARCKRDGVDLHAVNPVFTSVIGKLKYAAGRAMTRLRMQSPTVGVLSRSRPRLPSPAKPPPRNIRPGKAAFRPVSRPGESRSESPDRPSRRKPAIRKAKSGVLSRHPKLPQVERVIPWSVVAGFLDSCRATRDSLLESCRSNK